MGPCIAIFFVVWIITILITRKLSQWSTEAKERQRFESILRERIRAYIRGIITYVKNERAGASLETRITVVHMYSAYIIAYYRLLEVPSERDAQLLMLANKLESRFATRRQQ